MSAWTGRLAKASVFLAGLWLVGCGGSTRGNPDTGEVSGGSAQGGSAQGGSASAGSSAVAGSEATGGTPMWLSDVMLDEAFPWFIQTPGGMLGMVPDQGFGQEGEDVVHVIFSSAPVQATVSTHNHFAVIGVAAGVAFSAKASAELELQVSVHSALETDYFSARENGTPWPVARVDVGTDWQSYSVPFSEMQPPDPGGPQSFVIAFVVEHPTAPLELWLDAIHFE